MIDFGSVAGVVYYAPEPDGYRVVATFAQKEGGYPLRFEAVLAPGQSVVLSAPCELGASPRAVEISRRGDQVLVQEANVTD